MLKILFQGDSLTDCGRDKTGHNPVQAYGYGYVNLIASKLLCDYPDTVVWNKAYNGSRIADTYSRWIEDALNIDCNILSILSGVNDIGFAIRMNQGADAKKFKFIYELMINDALEKNKDCFFCVHKTVEVSEDEQPTGITFPEVECAEGKILPDEFLMMGQNYQFQTSSYLFNGEMWREYEKNPPEFKTVCAVGDETYMLYFASLGPVYYIDAAMSCYRRGVPTSWSERQKKGNRIKNVCRQTENMAQTLQSFDRYTEGKFHDICLLRESQQMYMGLMLSGNTRTLFKMKNREIFNKLSLKRKITAAVACCIPFITKKMYSRKLFGEK